MRTECPQAVTVVSALTQRGCPNGNSLRYSCKWLLRKWYQVREKSRERVNKHSSNAHSANVTGSARRAHGGRAALPLCDRARFSRAIRSHRWHVSNWFVCLINYNAGSSRFTEMSCQVNGDSSELWHRARWHYRLILNVYWYSIKCTSRMSVLRERYPRKLYSRMPSHRCLRLRGKSEGMRVRKDLVISFKWVLLTCRVIRFTNRAVDRCIV